MDKEKLESLLIDYIDNNLDEIGKEEVEKLLKTDEDVQKLFQQLKDVFRAIDRVNELEPTTRPDSAFQNALDSENTTQGGRSVAFRPVYYRIAAGIALLMVGIAAGYWLNLNNRQEEEMALLKQEMLETKRMMMSMLQNEQSASQRILGVNVAIEMRDADDDIVKALAQTLGSDPNTNVRLAALEALSKFIDDAQVRNILISSLSKQNDPVVQIALIQLLVKIKEKSVLKDLQQIIDDEKNIQAVKDEAHTGILSLS